MRLELLHRDWREDRFVHLTDLELGLLSGVPLADRAQVSDDARVHLALPTAGRTGRVFAGEISMGAAHAERRSERKVRQAVVLADFFYQRGHGGRVGYALAEEEVHHGAAGVFGLQIVLDVE